MEHLQFFCNSNFDVILWNIIISHFYSLLPPKRIIHDNKTTIWYALPKTSNWSLFLIVFELFV